MLPERESVEQSPKESQHFDGQRKRSQKWGQEQDGKPGDGGIGDTMTKRSGQ